MGLIVLRHKVRDFAKWKTLFDSDKPRKTSAGLTNPRLYRSSDDPQEVVILFDSNDLSKAKEMMGSAGLKEAMEAGGVVDKPTAYLLNEA